MPAHDLAVQNFAVAEHLLQLFELFRDLKEASPSDELRLAVCRRLAIAETTAIREASNDQLLLAARATAPIPAALLVEDGAKFLLRQAVVVSCTALESYFWDALRENVLTIVKVRRGGADESLRRITLSLGDYISLGNYDDPDERLRQIILKNFERGTLYDSEAITRIAQILTVKNFWEDVSGRCGMNAKDLRRNLDELIVRRNMIAHRADRPAPDADPPEEQDGHGLRAISYSWVNTRVAIAKSLVNAAHECFEVALKRMELQLAQEREQALARQTMEPSRT